MNSKSRFSHFFSKKQDSKRAVVTDLSNERERDDDLSGTNTARFFRSKSGRLKEDKKKRLALATDTFLAPEEMAQSAPVISINVMDKGLTSRALTKHESARMSQSLQLIFNSPPVIDASPTSTNLSDREHAESVYDCLDENEVF